MFEPPAPLWHPAQWPAPPWIKTAVTERSGGVSQSPYDTLNLALHVGDDFDAVTENRRRLLDSIDADQIVWLNQVHGSDLVFADAQPPFASEAPEADGSFATKAGTACAVLTADCVPALICDRRGKQVAAIHAGWRGLTNGILARAVASFDAPAESLLIYLGPAISASHYEVDDRFLETMRLQFPLEQGNSLWSQIVAKCAAKPGHYMFDLYALARYQMQQLGVVNVYGGSDCTFSRPDRFYSYRRDGITGRFASLIWIAPR